jgi:hypothetical protein
METAAEIGFRVFSLMFFFGVTAIVGPPLDSA